MHILARGPAACGSCLWNRWFKIAAIAKRPLVTRLLGEGQLAPWSMREMDKEENKQKVAMTELPAAVQKTIQDNLGGGTVTKTAKETKGGKTYYDAEVQKSGGEKVEIKVAEYGSLIGLGKEEEDDD
jgi:uncharacterized membrane protein YkoI